MKKIYLLWSLVAALLPFSQSFAQSNDGSEKFVPPTSPEMPPLKSHDTPAYRAAKHFQHGVNLGDYLEAWPRRSWGVNVKPSEYAEMKKQGFDHVRVPIGWQHYAGTAPDFLISTQIFATVDSVVSNALANQLAVIINIHHFDELDHDPAAATPEFLALWKQIAAHYKNYPPPLAFELDNEPHENATTKLMNPIYAQAISEIRQTNPQRTLFVEPGNWGGIDGLKNLVLPPDDNLIVSIHCYEPFFFTHQGASWAGADVQKITGIKFPGPPAQPFEISSNLDVKNYVRARIEKYNTLPAAKNPSGPIAFAGKLKYAHDWSEFYGRPVHLGEFGAYVKADPQSRANFYSAMRRTAERDDIGWCLWDWSANFRYWDKKNNRAMPGMHAALFGEANSN
ncbi:MAG TPA: glycoside hydrolase family 5 protein [Verrucomicrobiae bacterium]